jgi:replicative DNA helicase
MARSVKIKVPEDEEEANDPDAAWRTEFDQYAELIVAKQNRGPVGTVRMRFVKEYARFENVTTKFASNNPAERQQMEDDDL